MLESIDFLPPLPYYLKVLIYTLIIVHLAAFSYWCVIACPSIVEKKESFADRVDRMRKENKQKHL